MNERIELIRQRLDVLRLRAETQRAEFEWFAARARTMLGLVGVVSDSVRLARRHPIIAAVGLILAFRLTRLPIEHGVQYVGSAFRLWRWFREARGQ